jgi:hypothetical protein
LFETNFGSVGAKIELLYNIFHILSIEICWLLANHVLPWNENLRFNGISIGTELFLGRRNSVTGYFSLGPLGDPRLLTHRFAPNALLTRLADATLEQFHRFGADHTFFH